jgi:hypothetical protein
VWVANRPARALRSAGIEKRAILVRPQAAVEAPAAPAEDGRPQGNQPAVQLAVGTRPAAVVGTRLAAVVVTPLAAVVVTRPVAVVVTPPAAVVVTRLAVVVVTRLVAVVVTRPVVEVVTPPAAVVDTPAAGDRRSTDQSLFSFIDGQ